MLKNVTIAGRKIAYEWKYTRTRGIRLLYRPDQDPSFEVHSSRRFTAAQIEEFLKKNEAWILKQTVKQETVRSGSGFPLFGKVYQPVFMKGDRNAIRIENDKVILTQCDPENEEVTEQLVLLLWKDCLQRYIEANRARYEAVTGHKGAKIFYRDMKSRYGSCTPQTNRIRLNIHLAEVEPALIDGVVYHEYTHFLVHGHSDKFYRILSGYDPKWKENRKALSSHPFSNPVRCVKI